jgi:class 3 adenylate cyclase
VSVPATTPRYASPESYTPKHLVEKILSSKSALEGERKQVTVLFADLKDSMELLADRDPEEARAILDPVLERMMEAVHRYEGTVNQVMGDGIMALFGAPLAHEDHAVRACYAALAMQAEIHRLAEEARHPEAAGVRIRVGLNSGEVVVRAIGSDLHMDYTAVGQTTHLAARMEQLAAPGAVLLTAETLRLVEGFVDFKPLGPTTVKGLAQPVEVFQLLGGGPLKSRLQASLARGLSPLIGRSAELDTLHAVREKAAAGRGQIAGVVGEPGVGKSRLYWEFTHSETLAGWKVLGAVVEAVDGRPIETYVRDEILAPIGAAESSLGVAPERQAELGDRGWKKLLERHHSTVRDLLTRYRGEEQDTAGDGFYATFDGPARAIRCALDIAERVSELGIEIRAGIHTGECEMIDGKVGGLAVSIGARVAANASPSEVLVSQTVRDLVAGSGLAFEDAGEHELKGVPDRWHVYRVVGEHASERRRFNR